MERPRQKKRPIITAAAAALASGMSFAEPTLPRAEAQGQRRETRIDPKIEQDRIQRWKADIENDLPRNLETVAWITSDDENGMVASIARANHRMFALHARQLEGPQIKDGRATGQLLEDLQDIVSSVQTRSKEILKAYEAFKLAFDRARREETHDAWAEAWNTGFDLTTKRDMIGFARVSLKKITATAEQTRVPSKSDYPQAR